MENNNLQTEIDDLKKKINDLQEEINYIEEQIKIETITHAPDTPHTDESGMLSDAIDALEPDYLSNLYEQKDYLVQKLDDFETELDDLIIKQRNLYKNTSK